MQVSFHLFLEFVILIFDFNNLDRKLVKKLKKIDFLRIVRESSSAYWIIQGACWSRMADFWQIVKNWWKKTTFSTLDWCVQKCVHAPELRWERCVHDVFKMCSWGKNAIFRRSFNKGTKKYFCILLIPQTKRQIPPVNTSVNTSRTQAFDCIYGAWTHSWTHRFRLRNVVFSDRFWTICPKSAIRGEHASCIMQYALISHQFLTTCSESTWNSRQFLKNLKKLNFFSIFEHNPIQIIEIED